MKEALKLALEALEVIYDRAVFDYSLPADHFAAEGAQEAITAIKEALREHAMYEVQRLGQEIQPEQIPPSAYSNTHQPEQEPLACVINGRLMAYKNQQLPEECFLYAGPPPQ